MVAAAPLQGVPYVGRTIDSSPKLLGKYGDDMQKIADFSRRVFEIAVPTRTLSGVKHCASLPMKLPQNDIRAPLRHEPPQAGPTPTLSPILSSSGLVP